jgi:hypothetical protein
MCGTRALCNTSGLGCQTYADGSPCAAGAATCAADRRSALASGGACAAGACQPTAIPCATGYLCAAGACATPGGCTSQSDCDSTNGFVCTAGNCTLGIDASQ